MTRKRNKRKEPMCDYVRDVHSCGQLLKGN